jgi:hypothetical protein
MEPMPLRFFKLADDVMVPSRWHLAMPRNAQILDMVGKYTSVRDMRLDKSKCVGDVHERVEGIRKLLESKL